ncbi:hypothetical protein AbraIFM66951_011000 [Aspergillus brasiliensis]|uniref:PEP-utilising enzyme mobile domain-containing protein n=1 Tax=Aspergillus brasiliensis TaxID=319629 RepID=A0A9W5YK78_9EURO|nr:hypothetical protein AbraCBS73388_003861 [Aspergillus brasiliensis]GKZ41719.1 hypothetical protein AbraIFM66951_011000 [Aspergillus brasiliensis]
MKRAPAITADHGGQTSHATIVSRELGISAIVGTHDAAYVLHPGRDVTVLADSGLRRKGIGCRYSFGNAKQRVVASEQRQNGVKADEPNIIDMW